MGKKTEQLYQCAPANDPLPSTSPVEAFALKYGCMKEGISKQNATCLHNSYKTESHIHLFPGFFSGFFISMCVSTEHIL